jgi:flagellar L-ring protein FlgH
MLRNSFNQQISSSSRKLRKNEGWTLPAPARCPALYLFLLTVCACAGPAVARKTPPESFGPTSPAVSSESPSAGAIFANSTYVPLTSGARASRVGDLLTIVLVERTTASKSNSASTKRGGDIGFTPPTTGLLNLFKPSDLNMSGNQSFEGKGQTAQSNQLSGEVSVTIAAVYPNGTMLVRGEKQLQLNRGDERVQISGLVRAADFTPDNRVASTRVADARINYIGKGEIASASRQGWLQRFFSRISPF